jgi:hypothetical protein
VTENISVSARATAAREEIAHAEAEAHRLAADADAAESAFRTQPSAARHTSAAVARQLALNAADALEELRQRHSSTTFTEEQREALQAELERLRPHGEVEAAFAAATDVLATFRRDLVARMSAYRDAARAHNAKCARLSQLASQLGTSERFEPINVDAAWGSRNATTGHHLGGDRTDSETCAVVHDGISGRDFLQFSLSVPFRDA